MDLGEAIKLGGEHNLWGTWTCRLSYLTLFDFNPFKNVD